MTRRTLRYERSTIKIARDMYERGETYADITDATGASETTVWMWSRAGRWSNAARLSGRTRKRTTAQCNLDAARDGAARDASLYGALVEDVRLLRRRGFVVTIARDGGFDVGCRVVDADGLRALAARERRLAG